MRTEIEICRNALQVQDAPNLVAILNSFKDDAKTIRDLVGDWDKAYRHPAMLLYATQVLYLTGGGQVDYEIYSSASIACKRIIEAATPVTA